LPKSTIEPGWRVRGGVFDGEVEVAVAVEIGGYHVGRLGGVIGSNGSEDA
jgi:hypothetical protein